MRGICRVFALGNVLDEVQVFDPNLASCLSEKNELWQKQSTVQVKEQEERKEAKHCLNNESEARKTG